MRLPILILIIFFDSSYKPLDVGTSPINAVCSVTLKNGKTVEGMIVIVSGGYEGHKKNGFAYCFSDYKSFQYRLFNVDNFELTNQARFGSSRHNSKTNETTYPDQYYLSSITDPGEQTHQMFDLKTKIFTVNVSREQKYLVSKSFRVYTEFPYSNIDWIPDEHNAIESKSFIIEVDEIKRFTLMVNPSEKWLNLIRETREKGRLEVREDYAESGWYHEIRKGEERYKYLSRILGQQYFISVNKVEN